METRLQKLISQAGIASRREAEKLITAGKVEVDGEIIKELGYKADARKNTIKVNGKELTFTQEKKYYLLNKPNGYICSRKDEKDRRTVMKLVPEDEYLYPVGRLDYNTSGLLLITNDGEVANTLMHPRFKIAKHYLVEIEGSIKKAEITKLCKGIKLEDGITAPARVNLLWQTRNRTKLEVIITEGKNRQVRRMFDALGYEIVKLKRIQLGRIKLAKMPVGQYRELKRKEIEWLQKLVTDAKK